MEEQEVSGTVVFRGRTKPSPMAVTLRRELGETISVVSNADGSFAAKGLLPGHYYLDVRPAKVEGVAPTDGAVVAEQLGSQDVLLQGFDIGAVPPGPLKISLAAPVAKIPGKLVDAAGRPVGGTRTEPDGTFTAIARISGEHQVFVVLGDDRNDSLNDPDFIEAHASDFPKMMVAEGENPPLLLRLPAK
jgi:hypothetical protein